MKPAFKRILLQIEVLPKKGLFDLTEKIPTVTLIGYADDCTEEVKRHMSKEVLHNGEILFVVEETEKYTMVLTHETNILMFL